MTSNTAIQDSYHVNLRQHCQRRLTDLMAQPPSPKDMKSDTPVLQPMQGTESGIAAGSDDVHSNRAVSPFESSNDGHLFSGNDPENRYLRLRCSAELAAFNGQNLTTSAEERATAWHKLIEPFHDDTGGKAAPLIKSPFYMDYGNVEIASSAYIHRNVYISDNPRRQAPVKIGHGTFIGPGVHVLTVKHDVDWQKRDGVMGPTLAASTTISDNVYVGAGACIMPGVTIEEGAVIGAGAVVTKSIPAGHVAIGSPARVTRKVALDVPDAFGLWYELRDGKMMVLDLCSPPPELPLSSRPGPGHGFPACESRSEEALRIYRGCKDTELTESDCSGVECIQPPPLNYAEQVQWVWPDQDTPIRQTKPGVDVAIFLLAIGLAWGIVHAALY